MPTPLNRLHVLVRNPESVQFEGDVVAVSSVNDKGPFDILPQHSKFISIIKDKVILHLKDKTKQEIKLNTGIIKAFENNLEIFLDVESLGK